MRKIFFGLALLFSLQGKSQEFGTILDQEVKLRECSFDKAADAVILLDRAVSTPDDERRLITRRRTKFKILKPGGLDRGNLHIPFYSKDDFEDIQELEAYVYNMSEDGIPKKTLVDKKSIFIQKVNELYSEIKIALPEIKVGSIVEYQYTSVKKSVYGIRDWYFQDEIPTLLSHYDLTIQPGVAFAYKVVKSPGLQAEVKAFNDEGRVVFEMKNIGGLREEPYMDSPRDYLQRVVFQLSEYQTAYGTKKKYANSWPELARELLQDDEFGRAIEKNIKGSSAILAIANAQPNDLAKMTTILQFMKQSFSWNGIYSYFTSDGLNRAWEKRSGNSAEINLILVNLLKEAKLEVYPVLVSDRDHGKVDASYPFIGQFNKVVALVMLNGNRYILDAMDKQTPIDMIPFELLNTNAFVVSKKSSSVVMLKDDTRSNKNFYGVQATIDDEGTMQGTVNVMSFDYSRLRRVQFFREKNNKEQFANRYYRRDVSNVKIDSLQFKNTEADSLPLEQNFKFSCNMPASGNYRLVNLNLFGEIDQSPFVADNRFTDINFGCPLNQSISQLIKLPASMKPDALPKNISLVMPDNSITLTRTMAYDAASHSISYRIKWQITRTVFPADEYNTVKEFYKKMVDMLNEPLVLVKTQ